MATLTAPSDIRTEGSLPESSDVDVQDAQLTSAINTAYQTMLALFGLTLYEVVRTEGATERNTRWKHAEASFAVAELPEMLTGEQIARTGLIARKKTGEAETVFASSEEKQKIKRMWERKAYVWLSQYLDNEITEAEDDDAVIAFRTKDRRLTIAAI